MFAGGFDLAAADAVTETGDEVATLHLLDALVRKSLVTADRSSSRTRYSMLETIRQYGEEHLEASGAAADARDAHARHFAGLENEVLARWDGPRQREAYAWYADELANLRVAVGWAAAQQRPRHGGHDRRVHRIPRRMDRTTRAGALGRITDRHGQGGRPPTPGPALRRGRGVLPDGTADAGRRVRRRRRRADHR